MGSGLKEQQQWDWDIGLECWVSGGRTSENCTLWAFVSLFEGWDLGFVLLRVAFSIHIELIIGNGII